MFQQSDLSILCCPACKVSLQLANAHLECTRCHAQFPIINDIPRLLYFGDGNSNYNNAWDYKWTHLDAGKGYNYRILDESDPAYAIHNVWRYNEYDGAAFVDIQNGIAIDVGCGIGQYSVNLLRKGARRVYAIDLTKGVDIGRRIFLARYPELAAKIVFIQANARYLPLKTSSIDVGMALASLHHTGYLEACMQELVRVVKETNRFFVWIYSKPLFPIGCETRSVKPKLCTIGA